MSNKLVPAVKVSRGKLVPAVKVGGGSKPVSFLHGKTLQRFQKNKDEEENNYYLKNTVSIYESLLAIGLRYPSSISIKYIANTKDQNGFIELGGLPGKFLFRKDIVFLKSQSQGGFIPFGIPVDDEDDKASSLLVDFRTGSSLDDPLNELYYPNFRIWNHSFDPDCFKRVKIGLIDGSPILIKRVKIITNGICILDYKSNQFINASGSTVLLEQEVYETKKLMALSNVMPKPLCELPKNGHIAIDYNPVVWAAIKDLGQGWSAKYRSDFNDKGWCNKFAAWAVCEGMGIGPYSFGDLITWFDNNRRWIHPCQGVQGYVPYAELEEAIKPGYMIRFNSLGHDAIFVGWCDDAGKISETIFNPKGPINYFRSIDGGSYVAPATHAISTNDSTADMVWKVSPGDDIDRRSRHGFARTDRMMSIQPFEPNRERATIGNIPLTEHVTPFWEWNDIVQGEINLVIQNKMKILADSSLLLGKKPDMKRILSIINSLKGIL